MSDFKKLSEEFDEILEQLQSPEISVDDAVNAYEKGTKLIVQIEHYLEDAELKITKLKASQRD